jgi:D-psicose/D-tagatose/L-ribulose 3-epimerase
MKKFSRRDFIQASALALGSLGLASFPTACGRARGDRFRYAFCNEIIREYSWPEQCEIIGNAGYAGVEIAPFTLVKEGVREISQSERRQMMRDMQNAGIECAGLHWLLTPPPAGLHFTTTDNQQRMRTVDYLISLIDFCGDLGGPIMVFGSPGQRSTGGNFSLQEAKNNFADGLARVADHARDRNVKILVEALSGVQTDVVNTLSEAMEIVNKVDHPNIATMFDFHNTADETEPQHALVRKYYDHIHHVHVQNMDGTVITTDAIPGDLVDMFEVLKEKDYDKWVSLEVFDYSPGGVFIADEGMRTFREIERIIKA